MYRPIFTPWRYKYIKNIDKGGCFLCRAVSENADDLNLIPHRGREVFLILNKYPYTWGHVMVAPYRHISQFEDLNDDEWVEMMQLTHRAIDALRTVTGVRDFIIGINIGRAAGAGLESHLHLHIIPLKEIESTGDLELVELTRELRKCLEKSV